MRGALRKIVNGHVPLEWARARQRDRHTAGQATLAVRAGDTGRGEQPAIRPARPQESSGGHRGIGPTAPESAHNRERQLRGHVHQGFRSGDRGARIDRQEARRGRTRRSSSRSRSTNAACSCRASATRVSKQAERRIEVLNERGELKTRAILARRPETTRVAAEDVVNKRRTAGRLSRPHPSRRRRGARAVSCPCRSDCPAIVSEAMRYSVFAGGKRLRPVLTLAAADAVARRDRHSVRRSAAASRCRPPAPSS